MQSRSLVYLLPGDPRAAYTAVELAARMSLRKGKTSPVLVLHNSSTVARLLWTQLKRTLDSGTKPATRKHEASGQVW